MPLLPFGSPPSPWSKSGTSVYYSAGNVGVNTSSPAEAFDINSVATDNSPHRLRLISYWQTDSLGTAELIRLHTNNPNGLTGNPAKAAIAWFQDDMSTTQSKVWVQAHNYLAWYNPKTFSPGNVNTGTNQITITSHGIPNAWQVQFSSTGTLPSPLVAATNYYAKSIDANTIQVYTDSGLTSVVTLTTQGTGTHTVTPNNNYNNNHHQHFSIEVSSSDGQTKQTRFSIPWDFDTTEIGFFHSNVNVNDGALRINGANSSNKQLVFGNTLSDNLTPDLTNIRWVLQQNNATETGSMVGSDFTISRFNDSGAFVDSPFFMKRSTGYIGLQNSTPPFSLTFGSTTTGAAFFNTSDVTTNFERVVMQYASNIFTIYSGNGGTGIERNIQIGDTSTYYAFIPGGASGAPKFQINRTTNTSASLLQITATNLNGSASNTQYGLKIDPTVAQSGTASYAMLWLNPTESSTGSGTKYLIWGQVGGTTKFAVDNGGIVQFAGTNTTGAGIAALGSNSPATTNTAPYTWIQAKSADGSTVYIPAWK